jgi:alkylation response protein AidB-like acyl-CoA dehydrogenase
MTIDSTDVDDLGEFRARVRTFLDTWATPAGTRNQQDDPDAVAHGCEFQQALAAAGLAALGYPVELGGAGLDSRYQQVFDEVSSDYDMPSLQLMVGLGMCAPTLFEFGTDEQRRRYLPDLLHGRAVWCQLFSEPGAGSDVASLQTRAVLDGDEWVVNGQKVWTSLAHHSSYGLLLARTNVDVPKHKGISMFIIDMRSPGVTARPLRQMDGKAHFNEVFLDDVRLKPDAIIGQREDGWRATVAMLANERVAIGAGGSSQKMGGVSFEQLSELARRVGKADDPDTRQRLAVMYTQERILNLIGERMRAAFVAGRAPGPEGSVAKIASSLLGKQSGELAVMIAGATAQAWAGGDIASASVAGEFLASPMLSIAGGTTEIQKNIVGERVLGLPREDVADRNTAFRDLKVGTQTG